MCSRITVTTASPLDGGIEKWEAEGRPLEHGSVEPKPAVSHARQSEWQRGIAAREILDRLDDPGLRLVDVRGRAGFSGVEPRVARGGPIPGAVLRPWDGNPRTDGSLCDPSEIRSRAWDAGLRPENELVTYCQGGVRAAHTALALHGWCRR